MPISRAYRSAWQTPARHSRYKENISPKHFTFPSSLHTVQGTVTFLFYPFAQLPCRRVKTAERKETQCQLPPASVRPLFQETVAVQSFPTARCNSWVIRAARPGRSVFAPSTVTVPTRCPSLTNR